jgi:hypothetical protein
VARKVAGTQISARIKEDTKSGISREAKLQAEMGKAIVDENGHGAENRAEGDLVLARADKKGALSRLLLRRRLLCRVRIGRGIIYPRMMLLGHPGGLITASTTAGAGVWTDGFTKSGWTCQWEMESFQGRNPL